MAFTFVLQSIILKVLQHFNKLLPPKNEIWKHKWLVNKSVKSKNNSNKIRIASKKLESFYKTFKK